MFGLQHQPPAKHADSLSGLIERVTFFNEENGWSVLKVKAKGHRYLVAVVGSLPSVSAGEWVTAEGHWVQDREFGLQFRAEMINSTAPTTKAGIEKYLASGMVKGIGPVYAQKLVAKFSEKIFDIIETHSVRLEEVDGIGPKRRKRIKDAWAEQKVCKRGATPPDRPGWENPSACVPQGGTTADKPDGRSFARGLRWPGPLASQASASQRPGVDVRFAQAVSPLRGCAGLAALSTVKIPCRRTPFNFQTGS